MSDRIANRRPVYRVFNKTNAVVVFSEMVRQMNSRYRPQRMELLDHRGIINLMNDHVELEHLREGIHLELPAPDAIAAHGV